MVRRKQALDGLGQDIRDHIERETQDNIDGGMSPEEARRQAMIRFGNVALTLEDTQAVWGWPSLEQIREDLRYVLRTLRRKPAFALVVVLTLGFGIGLNTATFSIVNAALIRPLGFADPERLVALHERFGVQDVPFSPPDFLDVVRDQQSFDNVAAYANVPFELSGRSEPIPIDAAKVSTGLFSLLGVGPLLGRDFRPEEDRPGTDVAVLSWGLRVPPPRSPVEQQAGEYLGADGVHRRRATRTWQPVQSRRDCQAEARRVNRRSPSGARCPGTTDQCQLPSRAAARGLCDRPVRYAASGRDRRPDGTAFVAAPGGCGPRAPRDVRQRRDARAQQGRVAHA
jgi:MacB-like periplasmic core domain